MNKDDAETLLFSFALWFMCDTLTTNSFHH